MVDIPFRRAHRRLNTHSTVIKTTIYLMMLLNRHLLGDLRSIVDPIFAPGLGNSQEQALLIIKVNGLQSINIIRQFMLTIKRFAIVAIKNTKPMKLFHFLDLLI